MLVFFQRCDCLFPWVILIPKAASVLNWEMFIIFRQAVSVATEKLLWIDADIDGGSDFFFVGRELCCREDGS